MKRGWKIFWIVCGIVFCMGAAFCIAGRMMGTSFYEAAAELDARSRFFPGFLFSGLDDDLDDTIELTSKITDSREYGYGERAKEPGIKKDYSGIRKIDVDAAGIQLQVLASPDKDVHVEAVNVDKRLRFKCIQNRDELDITTTKKLRTINRIDGYATVWLLIPEEQLEELELSNDAGEVYVAKANAVDFSLDVGAGQAVVDDFTAQVADMECGAGEITATGTIQSEGDIGCGVGEIVLTLMGNETDFIYNVDCGIGEVEIGGESFSGIGVSKSGHGYDDDDEYHGDGSHGGKELSIECGIGSVSVDFREP